MKHEKQQQKYIFMISSATFVMPNWHFGAYWITLDRFYEEIDLKWHMFHKGMFQGPFIARQIYHLDSWNLVQNCSIASSFRTIYHCLAIISYIVSRTLNVREGYPIHPKILNFEQYVMVWILCRMHEKQQLNYISMLLSALFEKPDSHFGAYFAKLDHFYEELGGKDIYFAKGRSRVYP